jgi:Ca2+/H+ antiporter
MSGGQIAGRAAALIFAILLLLPGGCLLWVGIAETTRSRQYQWFDDYLVMLPIAAAILVPAGLLFWVAFRRRPGGGKPPAPPT